MAVRKKLGDLLIEAGAIDELQLKAALAHQRQWGGRIGRTLVEMRFVGEDQICDAVARQLGIPSVRLVGRSVEPALLELVPRELCERHWIFPLALIPGERGDKLQVAMSDPTNLNIIDELAFRTGKRIEVAVAPDSHIDKAIRQHFYGEYIAPPRPGDEGPPPAVQFGGRELETEGSEFVDEVQIDVPEFDAEPGGFAPAAAPGTFVPGFAPPGPNPVPAFSSAGAVPPAPGTVAAAFPSAETVPTAPGTAAPASAPARTAPAPGSRAAAGAPPVREIGAEEFDPLGPPPPPRPNPAAPRPGVPGAVPRAPTAGPAAWEYRPPGSPPVLDYASAARVPPPAAGRNAPPAPPPAGAATGSRRNDDLLAELFEGPGGPAAPDLVDALLGVGEPPAPGPRLPRDGEEMDAVRRELFAAPGEQVLSDDGGSAAPSWAPPVLEAAPGSGGWMPPLPAGTPPGPATGVDPAWGDVELLEEVDGGGDEAPLVMGTLLGAEAGQGASGGTVPADEAELLAALETMAAGGEALAPGKLLAALALSLIRSGAIRAADLLERLR
jgi:hypothetical protein